MIIVSSPTSSNFLKNSVKTSVIALLPTKSMQSSSEKRPGFAVANVRACSQPKWNVSCAKQSKVIKPRVFKSTMIIFPSNTSGDEDFAKIQRRNRDRATSPVTVLRC